MHPEVLAKAREEVDRVVGIDRLPMLADRDKLLYIDAILKEILRWNVVIPTGI